MERGLAAADADAIDAALDRADPVGRQVRVDRSRLEESYEAWVWVIVSSAACEHPWIGMRGGPVVGVLTWANSD